LESVAESIKEDISIKSGQDSTKSGQGSTKSGQGSARSGQGSSKEGQSSDKDNKQKSAEEKENEETSSSAGQGQNTDETRSVGQRSNSAKTEDGEGNATEMQSQEKSQSTPVSSKPNSSDKTTLTKRSKKYADADMQTEVGSRHGDEESDSGNEADVESFLENVSFPGGISRISMLDGPPSREQIQRNQAQMMATHLVQAALLAGAKDNITAMVVLLPGCGL